MHKYFINFSSTSRIITSCLIYAVHVQMIRFYNYSFITLILDAGAIIALIIFIIVFRRINFMIRFYIKNTNRIED